MKLNIGKAAGITVNTTEDAINKMRTGVPATTNATKEGVRRKWTAVKAAYAEARLGEFEEETNNTMVMMAIGTGKK